MDVLRVKILSEVLKVARFVRQRPSLQVFFSLFSFFCTLVATAKLPVCFNKTRESDTNKRATCWEQRLTLEGLQEQLVVGLNELQVGLLGCSHRGGGRLVQAVGFSPRSETRRVASNGGALSLWSHRPLQKTAKATVQPGVMVWFFKNKKEREREGGRDRKKVRSSSFVKTKE